MVGGLAHPQIPALPSTSSVTLSKVFHHPSPPPPASVSSSVKWADPTMYSTWTATKKKQSQPPACLYGPWCDWCWVNVDGRQVRGD